MKIKTLLLILGIIFLLIVSMFFIVGKEYKKGFKEKYISLFGDIPPYFEIQGVKNNSLYQKQEIKFEGFVGEMLVAGFSAGNYSRNLSLKEFSCVEVKEEKGYDCFFEEGSNKVSAFIPEEWIDMEKIQGIAQQVAKSQKYKLNVFDCTDFTYSLVGNLTKEGYDARGIMGYKKQNPKQVFHAWTEVNLSGEIIWIESTTGEIVTEENKYSYKPLKGYKRYIVY